MIGHTPKGMQIAQETLVWLGACSSFLVNFLYFRSWPCTTHFMVSSNTGKYDFPELLFEPKNGE